MIFGPLYDDIVNVCSFQPLLRCLGNLRGTLRPLACGWWPATALYAILDPEPDLFIFNVKKTLNLAPCLARRVESRNVMETMPNHSVWLENVSLALLSLNSSF